MPLVWLTADESHHRCAGAQAETPVVPAGGHSWLAVVVRVVLRVVGQLVKRTVMHAAAHNCRLVVRSKNCCWRSTDGDCPGLQMAGNRNRSRKARGQHDSDHLGAACLYVFAQFELTFDVNVAMALDAQPVSCT